jgi:mannose-6-phosphate isomerase-like protein (cupin superfamily)
MEKVIKPWGSYQTISDNNGYKVKIISVNPKQRLSLQSHDHRSEHWVITRGIGKVQIDTEFLILQANEYAYIPIKVLHRIENIGNDILEFVETQVGDYLGEDDIIRYEDDYGRIN